MITFIAAGPPEYELAAARMTSELAADRVAAAQLSAAMRVAAEYQAAQTSAFDRFMRAALPGWRGVTSEGSRNA